MNNEHNELNDIILNRNDKSDTRKKMLIGIGALAIVAIVIVIIMGRISGSAPAQLPQPAVHVQKPEPALPGTEPALPGTEPAPQPSGVSDSAADQHLDAVAEHVKEEAAHKPLPLEQSDIVVIDETTESDSTPVAAQPARSQISNTPLPKTALPASSDSVPGKTAHPVGGDVYIQVGSFSRYQPSASFLKNIERSGYAYTLYRVAVNGQIKNKVLVGPFKDRNDARNRLPDVRRQIESGAFIYTIKP